MLMFPGVDIVHVCVCVCSLVYSMWIIMCKLQSSNRGHTHTRTLTHTYTHVSWRLAHTCYHEHVHAPCFLHVKRGTQRMTCEWGMWWIESAQLISEKCCWHLAGVMFVVIIVMLFFLWLHVLTISVSWLASLPYVPRASQHGRCPRRRTAGHQEARHSGRPLCGKDVHRMPLSGYGGELVW